MFDPSTHKIALACGVAGAYVDVMDDVQTGSIAGSWGAQSDFGSTRPGVLSFDLDNPSGDYTPGSGTTSLTTPLQVGMGVIHVVDGFKWSGSIRSAEPYFVTDTPEGSFRVRVVCDDMLGDAARTDIESLGASMVPDDAYFMYRLNDAKLPLAERLTGFPLVPNPGFDQGGFTFDSDASPVDDKQVLVTIPTSGATQVVYASTDATTRTQLTFPANSRGVQGCWVTPRGTASWTLTILLSSVASGSGSAVSLNLSGNSTETKASTTAGGTIIATGPALQQGVPSYVAGEVTYTYSAPNYTYTVNLYVNGTLVATTTGSPSATAAPTYLGNRSMTVSGSAGDSVAFSHWSYNGTLVREDLAVTLSEADRITAIVATVQGAELDTLPANLSTAPIGYASTSGAALDALNAVIRTEQGYLWTETTGTLTAPVQKIKVRARDRGDTPAYTFTLGETVSSFPDLTTDLDHMVTKATARGPVSSQTATRPDLAPLVGSASDSTDVLLRDDIDLLAWVQDRLTRGAVTGVRLVSFTVDALRINRWADITAIRPGDRVRISDLPSQLGVDHFDGWVTGGSYSLNYPDAMLFTFYLQPALPDTGIYDTDVYDTGIYAF